ncbi:hypothetical protein D3C87_2183170 [compost metagenome]
MGVDQNLFGSGFSAPAMPTAPVSRWYWNSAACAGLSVICFGYLLSCWVQCARKAWTMSV